MSINSFPGYRSHARMPDMKSGRNTYLFFLAAIVILGLFLRLHGLGSESLWLDEGTSVRLAREPFQEILNEPAVYLSHPPLYFVLLKQWLRVSGDSEAAVRLPSAIFGVLSLIVFFGVSAQLFGKKTGLIAVFFLCMSAYHVHYSQEARGYALAVFFSLCAMYFFVKLLKDPKPKFFAGNAAALLLLLYTSYSGLLMVLVQNVYVAFARICLRKNTPIKLFPWMVSQFLVAGVFALWVLFVAKNMPEMGGADLASRVNIPDPFLLIPLLEYAFSGMFLAILSLLILYACIPRPPGAVTRGETFSGALYLSELWLLLPVVLVFVIASLRITFYVSRYAIVALPAFCLLAARGGARISGNVLKAAALCLVAIFLILNLKEYYGHVNKTSWREIAGIIDSKASPGDLVLFNPGYFQKEIFDHYSKREDLVKAPFPKRSEGLPVTLEDKLDYVQNKDLPELLPLVVKHGRVWLIQAHVADQKNILFRNLSRFYRLSFAKEFRKTYFTYPRNTISGARVHLFQKH